MPMAMVLECDAEQANMDVMVRCSHTCGYLLYSKIARGKAACVEHAKSILLLLSSAGLE